MNGSPGDSDLTGYILERNSGISADDLQNFEIHVVKMIP
jgi:hypothetical protein